MVRDIEDICRDCTYQKINKNFWRNEARMS